MITIPRAIAASVVGTIGGWIASNLAFWLGGLPYYFSRHPHPSIDWLAFAGIGWAIGVVMLATWVVLIAPTAILLRNNDKWRERPRATLLGLGTATAIVAIPMSSLLLTRTPPSLESLPYITGTLAAGAGTGWSTAFTLRRAQKP